MASKQRERKEAGLKRLALLGFGGLLVLLFLGVGIAEGIGDPSIPSNAVAIVEDAPEGLGTITDKEFRRAIVRAAAQAQIKPVPKPGEEQYEGLKETALGELLQSIWLLGQAAEMGYTLTPKEVATELKKIKEQSFESEKQFQEFVKESRYTPTDLNRVVEVQILSTKIQEQLQEEASAPSSAEIQNYYDAVKATQFTTPESRNIRIVVNKNKAKVEEAKAELEKDASPKSWEKVAKKYSSDPATKNKGGLQEGVTEGGPEPLNAAVFSAQQGDLEGPLQESRGFAIFEVAKITKEQVQPLEAVEEQISGQLSEQAAQQNLARFVRNWTSLWTSRTFCTEEVAIQRCANAPKGNGQSPEANPACYEANPAEPPEACPAPVTQVQPVVPGSVSVLEPEGRRLPQRPRSAGEEAAAGAEGELPPGVVPEEAPPEPEGK